MYTELCLMVCIIWILITQIEHKKRIIQLESICDNMSCKPKKNK